METAQPTQWKQFNRQLDVTQSCLAGSKFTDVNLSGSCFDNVNFSGATVHNANLSGWRVNDANFTGLQISNADLRGAAIVHSLTDGMTIDGISVSDLLTAYHSAKL
jgi:uncharacterized protein YjbI with pentapeptide repeats